MRECEYQRWGYGSGIVEFVGVVRSQWYLLNSVLTSFGSMSKFGVKNKIKKDRDVFNNLTN